MRLSLLPGGSWFSLVATLTLVGCGDSSIGTGSASEASTGSTGSNTEGPGTSTTPPTTSQGSLTDVSGSGSATDSMGDPTSGSSGSSGSVATNTGTSTGGPSGECIEDGDCDPLLGPAPCGTWVCNQLNFTCEAASPGCSDADQDGFGAGQGCACQGLDCDDNDEAVTDNAVLSCYSGPNGTAGTGACQAGTSTCTGGVAGPCVGEVLPSGEACNLADDNCDGQVDEDLGSFSCGLGACAKTVPACQNGQVGQCVANAGANSDGPMCNGVDDDCDGPVDEDCKSCVPVSLAGNDMTADGTLGKPFRTIQAAISWTVTNNGPKNVCVAAGPQCGATGTYQIQNNQTVTMANGISVIGRYESTNWTRCNNSVTIIQPGTGAGVTFPGSVQSPTVLDGFRIDRFNAQTTAGVTVDGATGAILASITISNTPGVSNSYGVNAINAGDVTITQSRIDAGNGSVESIGVRSLDSRVVLQNNCLSLNAQGRCDDFCANNPSIRGRTTQGTGVTYAVLLSDSPNSVIQSSALCANDAEQGAAIRISGEGAGITIRGNFVNAFGGLQDSHGIWMEDCGGAAPWIVDNQSIASAGDNQQSRVDGIRAVGECHPVIDSNVLISGGGEGQASNPTGVHCLANGMNVPSKCVVLGNASIRGSAAGYPPIATGVRCDDASCNRVERNVITGRGGQTSYGLFLQRTGAFVDRNQIRGGCSPIASGLHAENAFSRVQNNALLGFSANDCTGNPPAPQTSVGARVLLSQGTFEVDLHSNTIDAGGTNVACTGRAVELGIVGMAPAAGVGIFRNNILRAGLCGTARVGFAETMANADPRLFENNMLDSAGNPTALYFDEAINALTMAAQVDALADLTVSGTLSGNSMLVNPPVDVHLQNGSPCQDAGTIAGAPATDIDGATRDAMPDIGADEL